MRNQSHRTGWRPAVLAAAGCLLLAPAKALAAGGAYWSGFKRFWTDFLGDQDGVIVVVIVVGLISLLIITRVKGNKT
jgi:hypothetical protein